MEGGLSKRHLVCGIGGCTASWARPNLATCFCRHVRNVHPSAVTEDLGNALRSVYCDLQGKRYICDLCERTYVLEERGIDHECHPKRKRPTRAPRQQRTRHSSSMDAGLWSGTGDSDDEADDSPGVESDGEPPEGTKQCEAAQEGRRRVGVEAAAAGDEVLYPTALRPVSLGAVSSALSVAHGTVRALLVNMQSQLFASAFPQFVRVSEYTKGGVDKVACSLDHVRAAARKLGLTEVNGSPDTSPPEVGVSVPLPQDTVATTESSQARPCSTIPSGSKLTPFLLASLRAHGISLSPTLTAGHVEVAYRTAVEACLRGLRAAAAGNASWGEELSGRYESFDLVAMMEHRLSHFHEMPVSPADLLCLHTMGVCCTRLFTQAQAEDNGKDATDTSNRNSSSSSGGGGSIAGSAPTHSTCILHCDVSKAARLHNMDAFVGTHACGMDDAEDVLAFVNTPSSSIQPPLSWLVGWSIDEEKLQQAIASRFTWRTEPLPAVTTADGSASHTPPTSQCEVIAPVPAADAGNSGLNADAGMAASSLAHATVLQAHAGVSALLPAHLTAQTAQTTGVAAGSHLFAGAALSDGIVPPGLGSLDDDTVVVRPWDEPEQNADSRPTQKNQRASASADDTPVAVPIVTRTGRIVRPPRGHASASLSELYEDAFDDEDTEYQAALLSSSLSGRKRPRATAATAPTTDIGVAASVSSKRPHVELLAFI